MVEDFPCPCCGARDWEQVGEHRYARDELPGSPDPGRAWADRTQREFVFTCWLPGRDRVVLRDLLCRRCGIVVYSPRPTAADIDVKYETLRRVGAPLGAASHPRARRADRRRSRLVARALRPHLPERGCVLDVGGGDGRLLEALAEAGHRCAVVDYNPAPVPGVERLGSTLGDVPAAERFDAVVLSHVLEHVASPREMVAGVRERLTGRGALYAEVPVEVWRGTPSAVDPVTHVNHFTGAALRALLRRNGFRVVAAREGMGEYAGAALETAVAVAVPGEDPAHEDAAGAARRRLAPGRIDRARHRAVRARGKRATALRRRLGR